jgi:hypothetical protein
MKPYLNTPDLVERNISTARTTLDTARTTFELMERRTGARKTTRKAKLTLSVRPEYVAMLRSASARRGKSITELVEDIAQQLDSEEGTTKTLWADRMNGIAAGAFTDEHYERNDLLGALLRKHLPRRKK